MATFCYAPEHITAFCCLMGICLLRNTVLGQISHACAWLLFWSNILAWLLFCSFLYSWSVSYFSLYTSVLRAANIAAFSGKRRGDFWPLQDNVSRQSRWALEWLRLSFCKYRQVAFLKDFFLDSWFGFPLVVCVSAVEWFWMSLSCFYLSSYLRLVIRSLDFQLTLFES